MSLSKKIVRFLLVLGLVGGGWLWLSRAPAADAPLPLPALVAAAAIAVHTIGRPNRELGQGRLRTSDQVQRATIVLPTPTRHILANTKIDIIE